MSRGLAADWARLVRGARAKGGSLPSSPEEEEEEEGDGEGGGGGEEGEEAEEEEERERTRERDRPKAGAVGSFHGLFAAVLLLDVLNP